MIYKCCLKLCVEKAEFVFVVLDFAFLDEYWLVRVSLFLVFVERSFQ